VLETDSQSGTIWSVGNVQLQDRVRVVTDTPPETVPTGFVKTQGTITRGLQVIIMDEANTAEHLTSLPLSNILAALTFTVTFSATSTNVTVGSTSGIVPLPPGHYNNVSVSGNGILKLSAGGYFFNTLNVATDGVLGVDTSGGAVEVFIKTTMSFAGREQLFAGDFGQLRFIYEGTTEALVSASPPGTPVFAGIVIARNASIHMTQDVQYRGSFFGKAINLDQNTYVIQMPWDGSLDTLGIGPRSFSRSRSRAMPPVAPAAPAAPQTATEEGESVEAPPEALVSSSEPPPAPKRTKERAGKGTPRATRAAPLAVAPVPDAVRYIYGFSADVGAGPHVRGFEVADPPPHFFSGGGAVIPVDDSGVMTITDNRTYTLALPSTLKITDLTVQSSDGKRPYVKVTGDAGSAASLAPASRDPTDTDPRRLLILGLWLASGNDATGAFVIGRTDAPGGDFDWDEITIANSTIDPGGVRADETSIATLKILVKSRIKRLVIDRSIVGPIEVVTADQGAVDLLLVRDSIVDAIQHPSVSPVAIKNTSGEVRLLGTTVFGNVEAEILRASDSLVFGTLVAANAQASCFRFSAASPGGPLARLPRAFQAHLVDEIEPFFFTSLRFGDSGYAQLSRVAPDFVKKGAENGSELGAFSFQRNPIRLLSVMAKVEEFKPVGVLPQYIFEGEDAGGSPPRAP